MGQEVLNQKLVPGTMSLNVKTYIPGYIPPEYLKTMLTLKQISLSKSGSPLYSKCSKEGKSN